MLTQKQILKNIQHNTSKGSGGDTPTPTPEVFTGFDVFITGEGNDVVINYTAQEIAENIIKCVKYHGIAIIYTDSFSTIGYYEMYIYDQIRQLEIYIEGNNKTIFCRYDWLEQIARAGLRVNGNTVFDEEVQITSEMQEYFDYVLTNLGINR